MTSKNSEPALSEQTLENLSAFVDGESSEFERRRLLDMVSDDTAQDGIARKWQSYHLTGAAMRKELGASPMRDLSASISAALVDEPTFVVDQNIQAQPAQSKAPARLTDWIAKSAIAASVAFAVVVGVQFYQDEAATPGNMPVSGELAGMGQSSQAPDAPPAITSPVVTAPAGFDLPAPVARNVSLGSLAEPQKKIELVTQPQQTQRFLSNAAVEAELEQLFLMHAELSSENGRFGLMPMARASKMPAEADLQPADAQSQPTDAKAAGAAEASPVER